MQELHKKILEAIAKNDKHALSQLKENLATQAFLDKYSINSDTGDVPPEAWITDLPEVLKEYGIKG
ncbi:hypothetical protein Mucpa_4919 [Mucilaginibacter paludis DSM 18603]|uniref:Uncharacterized protein n=1 Tax=Mucilaginibacter paludis DSM 18603 TaxID=714943 RepID=H1Y7B6_9SPHI|nr:hypothetical protein Mucpa_4919 [Mucilaginibacter paludis DSM 18603]